MPGRREWERNGKEGTDQAKDKPRTSNQTHASKSKRDTVLQTRTLYGIIQDNIGDSIG